MTAYLNLSTMYRRTVDDMLSVGNVLVAAMSAESWCLNLLRYTFNVTTDVVDDAGLLAFIELADDDTISAFFSRKFDSEGMIRSFIQHVEQIASAHTQPVRLNLPIGVHSYIEMCSGEFYYVDKSLLIKDIVDTGAKVTLFTRPRRFGKTLNMDMLRVFFEKTTTDTSKHFKDKKIWQCGDAYRKHQGAYPVIWLSFKDIKEATAETAIQKIASLLSVEFKRHDMLADSHKCDKEDIAAYTRICTLTASYVDLSNSLMTLSRMLYTHHGSPAIIIIDEYDTPIQQGYANGYYDEIIRFMRVLLSSGLKDNNYLYRGFLTGILRVAKESLFSGLNNLVVNTVLDHKYSEHFGFTHNDIYELLAYYNVSDKYATICDWYDGYRFGQTDIFNPWSVLMYLDSDLEPKAYWARTSSNDLIGELLQNISLNAAESLESLLSQKTIDSSIEMDVVYPEMHRGPEYIYSFLLLAGYLTPVSHYAGSDVYTLRIPNNEIATVYRTEVLNKIVPEGLRPTTSKLKVALASGDADKLQDILEEFLKTSASYFDAVNESFYHGLMLGMCSGLGGSYVVTSNRESGCGRYDIQLLPKDRRLPGILIELKAGQHASAQAALGQIKEKEYANSMRSEGVKTILCYGIAFSGKHATVGVERI